MIWMLSFFRFPPVPGAPDSQWADAGDEESRLLDEYIESYVAWREQCADVNSAYERWSSGREESGADFAIYRAELEWEEAAAHAYRESAERLALWSESRPEPDLSTPPDHNEVKHVPQSH